MAASAFGHLLTKAHNQAHSVPIRPPASSKLQYGFQWVVLLLLCPPLLVLTVALSVPLAALLCVTGAVQWGKKLAADRDPVLAKVLSIEDTGSDPMLASLSALGRVYTSLVMYGVHLTLRMFVRVARPKTVFVVYTSNYHLLRKFFCVGTAELIYRAGISSKSM
jgi:hypothetical protein